MFSEMFRKVGVFVEIERGSAIKYELNKQTGVLEVDRIIYAPYVYPYAYGFIGGTLADDGDELDALIVTDTPLKNDRTYDAYIVCALRMEDEKGIDEKVICTLDGVMPGPAILAEIEQFFKVYKVGVPDKWSRTDGYMNQADAIALYEKTTVTYHGQDPSPCRTSAGP